MKTITLTLTVTDEDFTRLSKEADSQDYHLEDYLTSIIDNKVNFEEEY